MKRQAQPTRARKSEPTKFVISVDYSRVERGHSPHVTGTGPHDSRPKRQRTRQGQRKAWKRDFD